MAGHNNITTTLNHYVKHKNDRVKVQGILYKN
jgi:hypothetical protein